MAEWIPKTHAERREAIHAVETYAASSPEPLLLGFANAALKSGTDYTTALDRHAQLIGLAAAAADAVDGCDGPFDGTLRAWSRSIVDDQGRVRSDDFRVAFGALPNDIIAMRPADEVTVARKGLIVVAERADLQGDASLRRAFEATLDPLDRAVTASNTARREKNAQGALLDESVDRFDEAYRKLCRVLRTHLGDTEAAKILPRWTRKAKAKPDNE